MVGKLHQIDVQGLNDNDLFLISNTIASATFLPPTLGLIDTPLMRRCLTGVSALFGCFSGIVGVIGWAGIQQSRLHMGTFGEVRSNLPLTNP